MLDTDKAASDAISEPLQAATLAVIVQTEIDRGRYDAASAALDQAAAEGWIDQAYNAAAYRAALQRQWGEAARLHQTEKTPRQRRCWGTIF
jgi:hypothetical protein